MNRDAATDGPAAITGARHEHGFAHARVAVGSGVWTRDDVDVLLRAGITHVIDCRADAHEYEALYRGTGITHFAHAAEDDGKRKDPRWFREGVRAALVALRKPDAKLLVHCWAGVNRGPSLAYAILRTLGLTADDAARAIRRARPLAEMRYRVDAELAIDVDW